MIISGDLGRLPASLRQQLGTKVGRVHPLWRIVQMSFQDKDLATKIELYSCTRHKISTSQRFRLSLADTDPVAIKISELAKHHRLTINILFEVLVAVGWNHIQTTTTYSGTTSTIRTPDSVPAATQAEVTFSTAHATPPPWEPELAQDVKMARDIPFSETPEFSKITRSVLASFGIEI